MADEETWREPTRLELLRRLAPAVARVEEDEGNDREAAVTTPLPGSMSAEWLGEHTRLASV